MLKRTYGTVRGRDPGEGSAQVEVVRVSQSLPRHGDEVRKGKLSVVWSKYRTSIKMVEERAAEVWVWTGGGWEAQIV